MTTWVVTYHDGNAIQVAVVVDSPTNPVLPYGAEQALGPLVDGDCMVNSVVEIPDGFEPTVVVDDAEARPRRIDLR